MTRWLGMVVAAAFVLAACGDEEAACDAETNCASAGGASAGGGGASAGGAGPSAIAVTYCDCMLLTCHDAYHDTFGPESDEEAAREACLAEAETLPVAGMDVDSGNFVECRIHYCAMGTDDPDTCAATIGEGACAE